MAMIRLFPPVGPSSPVTRHGRSYAGAPGTYQDVPDFDAKTLEANGWSRVALVGPSAARPSSPGRGFHYLDTTLGKLIVFDGVSWRDPATAAAV